MVTDRYQHIRHHENVSELARWATDASLPVIGIDNVPDSQPLEQFDLPEACVLFFGQEGSGLAPDSLQACDAVVSIAQFGSTRSINVGAAAAIAMHAWVRRHRFGQRPT